MSCPFISTESQLASTYIKHGMKGVDKLRRNLSLPTAVIDGSDDVRVRLCSIRGMRRRLERDKGIDTGFGIGCHADALV